MACKRPSPVASTKAKDPARTCANKSITQKEENTILISKQNIPALTIGAIPANSSVVISVAATLGINPFKPNLPIICTLDSANAALNAGISVDQARYNSTTNTVDITFTNSTTASVTPTPPNVWLFQIQ